MLNIFKAFGWKKVSNKSIGNQNNTFKLLFDDYSQELIEKYFSIKKNPFDFVKADLSRFGNENQGNEHRNYSYSAHSNEN